MTGVGLEASVAPTFSAALALILVYSTGFAWLNRDRLVPAIVAAVSWSLAAVLVLAVTSTNSDTYWIVALAVLGLVVVAGTTFTIVRRRHEEVRPRKGAWSQP